MPVRDKYRGSGSQQSLVIRDEGFLDINPVVCGWEHCVPGHRYGPAARDYYLVHYVFSGQGWFESRGIRHRLAAGSLFLITPDELTCYQADEQDPWSYAWIGFTGQRCLQLLGQTVLTNGQVTVRDPRLAQVFESLRAEADLVPSQEWFVCGKIYELLALLRQKSSRPALRQEYVRQVMDAIKANYDRSVSVEDLARAAGLDRRYLSRIFAAETGQTPRDYLVRFRLERAAHYLSDPAYSVENTALSVGYADAFAFSKAFKRHFGVSPRQYRTTVHHRTLEDENHAIAP